MSGTPGRFRRRERVVHRQLNEGGVLLNLDDGSYFQVNPVGLLIWESLDGNDLEHVVSQVKMSFKDAPPSVAEDVSSFIETLLERDLILPASDE
jgi:hypothetical protein